MRFWKRKSAGKLSLASIPPTFAAARKTASGLSFLIHALTAR
jgi:hypothetical protein